MIYHISFSKQTDFHNDNPIIQAVRDVDRLETIGKIGILRCEQLILL